MYSTRKVLPQVPQVVSMPTEVMNSRHMLFTPGMRSTSRMGRASETTSSPPPDSLPWALAQTGKVRNIRAVMHSWMHSATR